MKIRNKIPKIHFHKMNGIIGETPTLLPRKNTYIYYVYIKGFPFPMVKGVSSRASKLAHDDSFPLTLTNVFFKIQNFKM